MTGTTQGICKLESCQKPFSRSRSWQEFCMAEHRDIWNRNHYCGHSRIIAECEVPGCEAHALFVMLSAVKVQFMQCDCGCGRWFERKTGKRFYSAPCRWKAKDEAEKARRAKLEARRAVRLANARAKALAAALGTPEIEKLLTVESA